MGIRLGQSQNLEEDLSEVLEIPLKGWLRLQGSSKKGCLGEDLEILHWVLIMQVVRVLSCHWYLAVYLM